MTFRRGIRRSGGHARRLRGGREPRRASPRFSPVRAAAALVALLSVLGLYGLGTSSVFAVRHVDVENEAQLIADPSAVEARTGVTLGTSNVFLVRPERIATALETLPSVTQALVSVQLPDTLRVQLVERQPILAWAVGDQRFAVDRDGVLFAVYPAADPGPTRSLPTVVDARAASASLAVGSQLDPLDLDAARRLGSLTPGDLGSTKHGLRITVDDTDGYAIQTTPGGPVAVFGFYTPTLRTPDLIPGQVRLLRSLLAGREGSLRRIVLASDTTGTYETRAGASIGPSPSASVAP